MTDDLREQLIEAFALDDAARAGAAEVLHRTPAATPGTRLVHKTYQPVADRNAVNNAGWNAWLAASLEGYVRTSVLHALADEVGTITGTLERELREEIASLREELGQLRADQQIMRAHNVRPIRKGLGEAAS